MAETRIRIQKDLEKSTTAQSIIKTDATNEPEYLLPGANGTVLTIVAGVPTWQTITFPSEYEVVANPGALPVTGSTDVIYYVTSDNTFRIWNGSAYVIVPTSPTFTLAGASGTSQTISGGDTMSILGANGFTTVASATDTLTVTPPLGTITGQTLTWNNTTSVWEAVTPSNTDITITGDTGTDTISHGETITFVGGTGLTSAVTAGTVTLNVEIVKEVFDALTTGTTVTLANTPITIISVTRNGLERHLTHDYTIAGAVLTFINAFGVSSGASGSEVVVVTYIK